MHDVFQIKPLMQIPLFRGLQPDDISYLQSSLTVQEIRPRNIVIPGGKLGNRIYIIIHGSVKVQVERDNGTVVIVNVLGPGQIIGELSSTDGKASSATVVTLERCVCASVDAGIFLRLRHKFPQISDNLLQILSARLRLANKQILALATMNAEGRIVHQLLALAQEFGMTDQAPGALKIPLRLTQSTLGEMTGLSRSRVNLVLKRLKKKHLISTWGTGRFRINNMPLFEQYATLMP